MAYYVAKAAGRRKADQDRNYESLIAYLRLHPCIDCGETDVRVLQFDHVDPRTKTKDVSLLIRAYSWKRALPEIAKCVVRCANCHRLKTLNERRVASVELHTRKIGEAPSAYAA